MQTAATLHRTAWQMKQRRLWVMKHVQKKSEQEIEDEKESHSFRVGYRSLAFSETEVITIEKTANRGPFKKFVDRGMGLGRKKWIGLCKTGEEEPELLLHDNQWICNKLLNDGDLKEDALL
eukprot:1033641-Rhodomonas_salina.1